MTFNYAKETSNIVVKDDKKVIEETLEKYPIIEDLEQEDRTFIYQSKMKFLRNNHVAYTILKAIVILIIVMMIGIIAAGGFHIVIFAALAAMLLILWGVSNGSFDKDFTAQGVIDVPLKIDTGSKKECNLKIHCDEEYVKKCNEISKILGLGRYYNLAQRREKTIYHDKSSSLSIPVMIINSINYSMKTQKWEKTDKIIGAASTLIEQNKYFTQDKELISTLKQGIRDEYLSIMEEMFQHTIAQAETNKLSSGSQTEYWKMVLDQNDN